MSCSVLADGCVFFLVHPCCDSRKYIACVPFAAWERKRVKRRYKKMHANGADKSGLDDLSDPAFGCACCSVQASYV